MQIDAINRTVAALAGVVIALGGGAAAGWSGRSAGDGPVPASLWRAIERLEEARGL